MTRRDKAYLAVLRQDALRQQAEHEAMDVVLGALADNLGRLEALVRRLRNGE